MDYILSTSLDGHSNDDNYARSTPMQFETGFTGLQGL